jgi:hypothetical protein
VAKKAEKLLYSALKVHIVFVQMHAPLETVRRLREELGDTVTGFAKRVSAHRNTIHGLENGTLELSRRVAIRISQKTGANANWLLANDANAPITDWGGRPWSREKDLPNAERLEQFPEERPLVLAWQLETCLPLLTQYLLTREVIEHAPNSGEAASRWRGIQKKALDEFVESYGPDSGKLKDVIQRFRLSGKGLNTIRDDIDAVIDLEAQWRDARAIKTKTLADLLIHAGKANNMLEALGMFESGDPDLVLADAVKALKKIT